MWNRIVYKTKGYNFSNFILEQLWNSEIGVIEDVICPFRCKPGKIHKLNVLGDAF